ncbi:putative membrane protein YfcA [Neisseria sp. HSC-16F19]|nr:sulfite exporter TauE/SafE family protein [Neisseria sp. HSC-16F19]MCP2041042.1 putative membrane protein YfcA [Neisseria sp. HSC-16F19]
MLTEFILTLSNLATSLLTGITGLGGGMILLGLMPLFLPAAAIVPVHGVTQLAANASRAWFGRDALEWRYFRPFLVGSLAGIAVFGVAVHWVNLDWIPLFIGIYILLLQWAPRLIRLMQRLENFYVCGFIQTGLGLFVGAPGPLAIAMLNRRYDNKHMVVSVGALMMSVVHFAKLPVYLSLGFSFAEYGLLMAWMVAASIAGSWLGVRLRHRFPMPWLAKILPWLLTAIALKLIVTMLFF